MGSYESYYTETIDKQVDVFVNEYYFKELSKVKVSSQEAVERNISKIRLGRAKIRKAVSKTLFFQEYIIKRITQIINAQEDEENVILGQVGNMEDLFNNLIKLCKLHKDAKICYKIQKTDSSPQHRIQYAKAISRFNRALKRVGINPIIYEKVSTSLIETVRLRKKYTIEAEKIKNYLQSLMVDPDLPDTTNTKPDIANKISEYHKARREVDKLNELIEDALPKINKIIEEVKEGTMLISQNKQEIVQANLRLVITIAKKYSGRGVLFDDLVQEGNIGLLRAIDKYDINMGFNFTTYATFWIHQHMQRAIENSSKTVRVPSHLYETVQKITKAKEEFMKNHERQPSEEEIAEMIKEPVSKVVKAMKHMPVIVSLDANLNQESEENDEFSLHNIIQSHAYPNPEEYAIQNSLKDVLEDIMAEFLSEREATILKYRYGLIDGYCHTLDELSKMLNITRERVRQIENVALSKLRRFWPWKILREYIV